MENSEYLDECIERLIEIAGKTSDEIYEQGNIEISVDDVFAIHEVLNELFKKESYINTLKQRIERKNETIRYFNERVKELKNE